MAQMNKQEVVERKKFDEMRALLFDYDAIHEIRVSLVFMHMLMVLITDTQLSASLRHSYAFYDNFYTLFSPMG